MLPSGQSRAGNVLGIPSKKTHYFRGHESLALLCAWSPRSDILATGSLDSVAKLWDFNDNSGYRSGNWLLHHNRPTLAYDAPILNYVSALDWRCDGEVLATGARDGFARIFDRKGNLVSSVQAHSRGIFTLKWNRTGEYIASAGGDGTTTIWEVPSGSRMQQFAFHRGAVQDLDWYNETTFASCGVDTCINISTVHRYCLNKMFLGHTQAVNCVKWSPDGQFLASCSADMTVKIWRMDRVGCVRDIRGHTKQVYTVRWSPTGPGTNNPNARVVLASGGYDTTVRLWNVERGVAINVLAKHIKPVYTVAFSPDGKFIATGGFDKFIYIWSMDNGQLVNHFKGTAGFHEVCWNARGDKIGAAAANGTLLVHDFRMM